MIGFSKKIWAGLLSSFLLVFTGTTMAALSFNEGGIWYEDNAILDGVHYGYLYNPRSNSYVVGVANGQWGSIGRFFTPPAGKTCTAYTRARFSGAQLGILPGELVIKVIASSAKGALEVIDADTWTYKKKQDFTVSTPYISIIEPFDDNDWYSTSWIADGRTVMVRTVVYPSGPPTAIDVEQTVVQCDL